jgi:hypothetical protein
MISTDITANVAKGRVYVNTIKIEDTAKNVRDLVCAPNVD